MTRDVIDLDDIVGELEPHVVRVLGREFTANADPAMGVLYELWKLGTTDDAPDDTDPTRSVETIQRVLAEIFGSEQGQEIFELCGTRRVMALMGALMEAYENEGKAPGSSRASRRAGGPSKRTSNGSTKSTSGKRASGRNGSAAVASRA